MLLLFELIIMFCLERFNMLCYWNFIGLDDCVCYRALHFCKLKL